MKKRICYINASSGDWGGASRVLFTNLKMLDRERYEPILLLPKEGPILPALDQQGIRYEIWGRHHEFNGVLDYIKHIYKALLYFKLNKVNLLHINHSNYWRPAEIIAARILNIPVITHYHVVNKAPGPFVKRSALIVANSEFTAKSSEPKNIYTEVVYCSVELERYDHAVDIRDELGLEQDDVVISFIGQIREIKGIDLFIKLANSIRDENVKFLIVGECRDTEKFSGSYTVERLLAEIGNNPRVHYIGYRADVQNLYHASDIIVMPSRWDEPFGLINIEAGASYKPVIATRVGGIPEIICHGENGYLIERDDLESLVRYTKLLISDPQLRKIMGQRAREIVEEKFTTAPIRKLEKLYDSLI